MDGGVSYNKKGPTPKWFQHQQRIWDMEMQEELSAIDDTHPQTRTDAALDLRERLEIGFSMLAGNDVAPEEIDGIPVDTQFWNMTCGHQREEVALPINHHPTPARDKTTIPLRALRRRPEPVPKQEPTDEVVTMSHAEIQEILRRNPPSAELRREQKRIQRAKVDREHQEYLLVRRAAFEKMAQAGVECALEIQDMTPERMLLDHFILRTRVIQSLRRALEPLCDEDTVIKFANYVLSKGHNLYQQRNGWMAG